ncbi:hypothetical protein SEUCBS139899_010333 [Sporothrix eucalyptigena]
MAVIPPPHISAHDKELHTKTDNANHTEKRSFDHVERVQGTIRLYDDLGNVRKIPVPTTSPNDPLNFPSWKRVMILVTLVVYGIAGFGLAQSAALFFNDLIPEYLEQTRGQFNPAKIANLASYPSLCMGIGNFLSVPLSMLVGRRPVFLFNNCLMIASCVWAAESQSYESHLASRCVQGLTCGISDCLLPLIVLDITFLHRRGLWMSIYWACTAAGSTLLLVAVPFVVQGAYNNWRFNYWFWTAFASFSLVFSLVFLPETLYARPPAMTDGLLVVTDEYGNVTFFDGDDADIRDNVVVAGDDQTRSAVYNQLVRVHVQPRGFKHFLKAYLELAKALVIPSIFWVLLLNACFFGGLVSQSLTYAQVLAAPPWLFGNAEVGTAQVGSAIGALVALVVVGLTVDPVSQFLTRKNKGMREPEHLLPTFFLPVLFSFLGLLVYGIVAGNPAHYKWISLHISFALYYCGFVSGSAVTGVWVGEVMPHTAGAALVLVCGGRNVLSFAISNEFPAWIAATNFQTAYITLGGITLAIAAFAIPLYFVNKTFRRYYSKF